MSKKYFITHDRDICIGCSACASCHPAFWKMDDKDGKSNIKNDKVKTTKTGNGEEEKCGSLEKPLDFDFEENLESAESCPVNCIHITKIDETKNKKENEIT